MNTKQDARKLDLIGKEDLRRRTVRAVIEQNLSKVEAARVFGVSRTSVHSWIALYDENGEDGLIPKRPGRPKCGGQLKGWQAATSTITVTPMPLMGFAIRRGMRPWRAGSMEIVLLRPDSH